MGKRITFSCGANAGNPERASHVANHNAGFASSFRSRIQPYNKFNFRLPLLVNRFGSTDFLLGP